MEKSVLDIICASLDSFFESERKIGNLYYTAYSRSCGHDGRGAGTGMWSQRCIGFPLL